MSNSFETGSVDTHTSKTGSDQLDPDAEKSAELSGGSAISPVEKIEQMSTTERSPQGTVQSKAAIHHSSELESKAIIDNQSHRIKPLNSSELGHDSKPSEATDLLETIDPEEAEIDENTEIDENAEIDGNTERSPLIRGLISLLFATMAIGAVVAAVNFAIFLLVNPKNFSIFIAQEGLSCQAKINGQWQTNWGKIALQEQTNSNLVTGEYTYQNLNRGKVEGKLEGQLAGDTLNFDWQETAQRGQKSLQGRGSFLFTNNCQGFSGSYGLEQSQTGWSNWSGQVLEVVPISQ